MVAVKKSTITSTHVKKTQYNYFFELSKITN